MRAIGAFLLGAALCLGCVCRGVAAAELEPGDIVVIAYDSTRAEDHFAWASLRGIPSNTLISFTDSSVSNGLFRWTEHLGQLPAGPLTWSDTNDLAAGTVVRFVSNFWSRGTALGAAMNFSTDGDQIFIYTGRITNNPSLPTPWRGDASGATMIFGITFANGGWNNSTGGSTTDSFIPPGLSSNNHTAVYTDSFDNGFYRGILTGTVSRLRKAIATRANWVTGNSSFDPTNWPVMLDVRPDPRGAVIQVR